MLRLPPFFHYADAPPVSYQPYAVMNVTPPVYCWPATAALFRHCCFTPLLCHTTTALFLPYAATLCRQLFRATPPRYLMPRHYGGCCAIAALAMLIRCCSICYAAADTPLICRYALHCYGAMLLPRDVTLPLALMLPMPWRHAVLLPALRLHFRYIRAMLIRATLRADIVHDILPAYYDAS